MIDYFIWYGLFISAGFLCFAFGFVSGRAYQNQKQYRNAYDKLNEDYEKTKKQFEKDLSF